jgi:hypothetical protein
MPATFTADEVGPPEVSFSPDEVKPPLTFEADEVKPPDPSRAWREARSVVEAPIRIEQGLAAGLGDIASGAARGADIVRSGDAFSGPPTPTRTLGQRYRAFQSAMDDPRYAATLTRAQDDPAKLARAERLLGPTAKLDMLQTGETARAELAKEESIARQQRLETESPTYQWGREQARLARKVFAGSPDIDDTFVSELAVSAGGTVPTIILGAVPGVGTGLAVGTYGLQAGEQQAQEAIAAGQPEAADIAYLSAAGLGAVTEQGLGAMPRLFKIARNSRLAGIAPAKFQNAWERWSKTSPRKAALSEMFLRESTQEALEQAGQNLIASELAGYDPDRPVTAGVGKAWTMGGILGVALGGPVVFASHRGAPPAKPPAEDFTKPQTVPPVNDVFAEPLPEAPKPSYAPEEVGPPEPAAPVEAAPPPAQGAPPATVAPTVETTADRFARERRKASAGMARMRQLDELQGAMDQVREDIQKAESRKQKAESEVAPTVTTVTTEPARAETAIPVTEQHLTEAREILAQTERPPDVLDDLEGLYPDGVRFPAADFGTAQADARETMSQLLYQKPWAKLRADQRRKVDNAHGISLTKGEAVDTALGGLASNPKYADWTAGDLADAMLKAAQRRIAGTKPRPADVQRVAEELANSERGTRNAETPAEPVTTAPTKAAPPRARPDEVSLEGTVNIGEETSRAWRNSIPTFQGGKRKIAATVSAFIRKAWTDSQRKAITQIDDYFGGSGGWGLFNALSHFPSVRKLVVHEFEPARLLKINLFHEQGNKFGELFRASPVSKLYQQAKAQMAAEGVTSATALTDRLNRAAKKLTNPVDQAIAKAIIDHGEASFSTATVDSLVKLVSENAKASHDAAQAFRKRGGTIEYEQGDSFAVRPDARPDVLAVLDPPYPDTAGYQTSRVGFGIFNQTSRLIQKLRAAGQNILYTDAAWFEAPKLQSDFELDISRQNLDSSLTHKAYATEGKNRIILGANVGTRPAVAERARPGQPVSGGQTERPVPTTSGIPDRSAETSDRLAGRAAGETAPVDAGGAKGSVAPDPIAAAKWAESWSWSDQTAPPSAPVRAFFEATKPTKALTLYRVQISGTPETSKGFHPSLPFESWMRDREVAQDMAGDMSSRGVEHTVVSRRFSPREIFADFSQIKGAELVDEVLVYKPAVDPIDAGLTRAIDALRAEPGATYSDPLFIQTLGRPALRGALQVVRASYRAGKQLAEAINEGIKWLKAQGKEFDETEARAWLEANVMPTRPGEGQNTHRFVSQLEASADLTPELKQQITARVYDVRRQQDAAAAAQLILTEQGPDRAAQLYLDPTVALPGDVRTMLAQAVILHWSEVERGMMLDSARRAEAQAVRSKNADFANAVMGQQEGMGQGISAWKGFWQQTPEGMVLAARRQIEGAGNKMVNDWTDLTQLIRQRLETTHNAAVTDTLQSPDIQRVASEAMDHAVATDPAVRQATRAEAHEALINDPKIRVDASKLAGADMTDVLNIVLDHFRFTGKDPRPLPEKLKAAGVPENYARGFASSLEAAWKAKVAAIEAALPKRIRNARLSAEVLSLAESIVRGLETQADAARMRLKDKFARMSANVDPTIIADLAIIGAAHLGRATLDFAQWSAKMIAEFGDKVKPFLDEAWNASKQRLQNERDKHKDYQPKTRQAKRSPDAKQPELPAQAKPGEIKLPRAEPPAPASDLALDKLIRAKLREKQLTLSQALKAVREDQLGQELGHALVEQSGLKGEAAERLRDAINRRFKALATTRKEAELRRILKAQSEGRSAPVGMQRSWKEVVEWSNQGVLTDARWQDAIRARLGVKRLSPEELQRLDKLARDVAAIPAGEETRRMMASNKLHGEVGRLRANWWDLPLSVWFSNALSGLQTHEINLYANLANFTVEAAILGRRAPLLASAALIRSLPEAGRAALLALTHGQTPGYRVGKIAAGSRLENLRGWENLALPLRYVFRALKGADLLFFVPAAEMKQAVAAKVIARQKGLRGEALAREVWQTLYGQPGAFAAGLEQARAEGYTGLNRRQRAWEITIHKRSKSLREAGSQFALDTTFNNSPYGFWGGLSDNVRAYARDPKNGIPGKLSQIVAPFTPIVSNVLNQGVNFSPWGYFRATKAGWRMRNGKEAQLFGHQATREEVADELVRATLGTLAMSAALLAFGTDDDKPWEQRVTVHGQGPRDKGRRDALRAAGWIPNSLQVGKKFYALEPYPNALPLAIVGNWLDASRYQEIDQKSATERLAYSLYQTRDTILNRSFLSGLAQMLAVKDTPTRTDRQMTDALARMGANFVVPNFFRALDRWQDPKVYDEPGIRGALMAQVPWLRREGRPVLNDLGEPITRPLDKRWGSEVSPDPVWTFMAQHNLSARVSPDQDIGPFKMTEEQVYDFTRRRGQILRQMLEEKTKHGPPLYVMLGRVFDGNAQMTTTLLQRFPTLDPDKLDLAGRAWTEVKAEASKRARKGLGLPTTPRPD